MQTANVLPPRDLTRIVDAGTHSTLGGGSWMQRLSTVPRRLAFQIALLVTALILFCKPVLLPAANESPGSVVLELFVPWGLVVAVLIWAAQAYKGEGGGDDEAPAERSGTQSDQD
jgi:hypothetical protein